MKKFLIFILAAILSLCALTACHGGNPSGGNNGDNSGNGGAEIVLPDLPSGSDETEKTDESGNEELPELPNDGKQEGDDISHTRYTANTSISDVINDPVFGNWGRMIFPVNRGYYSGSTLGNLSLTWYSHINVAHTVEICNYLPSGRTNGL